MADLLIPAFRPLSMVGRAQDQSVPSGNRSFQCFYFFSKKRVTFFSPHNVHYITTLLPCWEVMPRFRELTLGPLLFSIRPCEMLRPKIADGSSLRRQPWHCSLTTTTKAPERPPRQQSMLNSGVESAQNTGGFLLEHRTK